MKKKKISETERISNRVIVNYIACAAAYLLLYILNRCYMKPKLVLPIAGMMLVAAAVCYLLKGKAAKTKNYGHMFLAFSLALAFCNVSFIFGSIFGINTVSTLLNIGFFKMIFNSHYATIMVAIAGGVYVLAMTIINVAKIMRLKRR